jgi:hypothetical protein
MVDIPHARRSPMEHERDAGDDLIARAKAVMEGVTPGPWVVKYDSGETHLFMNGESQMCDMAYYPWVPENPCDWRFIAAARTLVPDLLAALEQAQARAEAAEAEAERLRDALRMISEIENKMYGGDWDEIEEVSPFSNYEDLSLSELREIFTDIKATSKEAFLLKINNLPK